MELEQLQEQISKGTFYYYKENLYVKGKIYDVENYFEGQLDIFFNGGVVCVDIVNIKKVQRPGNIVSDFKWCYLLKNEDNECIGYIGEKEDE